MTNTPEYNIGWRALFFGASIALLSACSTTTEIITANATPAIQATVPLAEDLALDIGVLPLAPNIPQTEEALEKSLVIPDVRRAESQFMAVHLKDTLEQTGNWGAVRVTPTASTAVDLVITGKILQSDGEQVRTKFTATDASGRVWVNKTYKDQASKFSYRETKQDPFQDLYNEFANDLLAARGKLSTPEIKRLRNISSLRFASTLSPDAFASYISQDNNGRFNINQLPAENDKMFNRVERIKEREYLFVDTLDEYYGNFYRDMQGSYNEWRRATYEEGVALKRIKKQARNNLISGAALVAAGIFGATRSGTYGEQVASAGVVAGGIGVLKKGFNRKQEAEIHGAALKELSESLGSEITPFILDIEGRTVELKGTAAIQYQQWQKILKEIYTAETGLPAAQKN